jgi:hypothetical protein
VSTNQSLKELAHDLAVKASGAESRLLPLLSEALVAARAWSVTADLLGEAPFLPDFPVSGDLRRAMRRLVRDFRRRAERAGVDLAVLQRARLHVVMPPGGGPEQSRVRSELVTHEGREYGHQVEAAR